MSKLNYIIGDHISIEKDGLMCENLIKYTEQNFNSQLYDTQVGSLWPK